MLIAAAKLTLRAPWVRSLKEKRMIAQSLIARVSQKFHVSAAEVEQQDVHQTIVVGVAAVVGSAALGDAVLDKILRFVEETCEAELTGVEREQFCLVAALFDGLFYCKALLEEYGDTGDPLVLEGFRAAAEKFDPSRHGFPRETGSG